MHCAHCGKEIGDKHKCSCCGAAQHSDDLFAVLGDLGPNTNDGRMESVVNEPIASITYGDYFSELGDIPTNEDCSLIMQADNTASENVSSTDPFHVLGNLDGSPNLLDDTGMDAPATGGFKPMDELIPSNDALGIIDETDLPVKPDTPESRIAFTWKKWMAIAASIAAIIAVLFFGLSPRENAYEAAIADKIASEMIQGEELPLVYQYNNTVLGAIDFQLLDADKSTDTATVRFTYVDVLSLADKYVGSMNDPSLFYTHCIGQIASGSAPTLTKTITVSFAVFEYGEVKKLIALDSVDFANVLTGGVASEYAKLSGGD